MTSEKSKSYPMGLTRYEIELMIRRMQPVETWKGTTGYEQQSRQRIEHKLRKTLAYIESLPSGGE